MLYVSFIESNWRVAAAFFNLFKKNSISLDYRKYCTIICIIFDCVLD